MTSPARHTLPPARRRGENQRTNQRRHPVTSSPEPAFPSAEPLRLEGKQAIQRMRGERDQMARELKHERRLRRDAERKARMYDHLIADIAAAQHNQENQS